MRKYLQITVVLSVFFLVVFLKQQRIDDEALVPINKNKIILLPSETPTSTPIPISTQSGTSPLPTAVLQPTVNPVPRGQYKDGNYTGSVEDAFYGNIQVQAKIVNGKIVDVVFLQFPNDNRTSQSINSQADPMLTQEAIQAQNANVDIISGASASSQAFQLSLANALAQAK